LSASASSYGSPQQPPAEIRVVLDPVTDPGTVRELVQCRVNGIAVFDFESFFERTAGKLPVPFMRDS
jgi:hypothetical protein